MNTIQDVWLHATQQGVFMNFFRSLTGALLASLLVACGGGATDQAQKTSANRPVDVIATYTGNDLTRSEAAGLSSPSYGMPTQGADLGTAQVL